MDRRIAVFKDQIQEMLAKRIMIGGGQENADILF